MQWNKIFLKSPSIYRFGDEWFLSLKLNKNLRQLYIWKELLIVYKLIMQTKLPGFMLFLESRLYK